MNAICLVLDRLHAGYLGTYGNAWIGTPSMDRLASQSIVFDRALIDSPDLNRLYRSYWQGWHALGPQPPNPRPGLPSLLREANVSSFLLTDTPHLVRHPAASEFDQIVEFDPPWQNQPAAEIEQTHFGRCFMQIIQWLERLKEPFLLWCHLGGLGTTWDAPLEFRRAYQEEGDPEPPDSADVPDLRLPPGYDPDELLGISQAYCGQVSALDSCIGALLEYIDTMPSGRETLLTLTSSRGFPLGEHLRVGPCDNALFGELVHVPWMMRFPYGAGAAARSQALVEPSDLWATLLDFWEIEEMPRSPTAASLLPIVRQTSDSIRDRLCVIGDGSERAIQTPAWHLRVAAEPQLFAKPDDRWEVNNVASRCPEVVECLQDAMLQYELTLPCGQVADLPALSDVLLHGIE